MKEILSNCEICPRKCNIDRHKNRGFCLASDDMVVSKIDIHYFEEPCFCDEKRGVGAVFFSGCSMHCIFCQNIDISSKIKGVKINTEELAEDILRLQDMEVSAIDFVTPTHYTYNIIKVLDKIKHKLKIPVVWNSSGFENIETIRELSGYVDIFLPDFKFFYNDTSKKYAGCEDYPEICKMAIKEMVSVVGKLKFNGDMLEKGTIVRHLCLPGHRHESIELINYLGENFSPDEIVVSLMSQFTPVVKTKYSNLNRKITKMEYYSVLETLKKYDFIGYSQSKSSANDIYIPDFDDDWITGK